MSQQNNTDVSPFDDNPNGGRPLLFATFIIALIMLALIRSQTVPGSMGQTAMSGGWWAEPALAPFVALLITIIASGFAVILAKKQTFDWANFWSVYGKITLISALMISAVMLMKIVGFALSILIFSCTTSYIAGYRKLKLVFISFCITSALVLIFRVGFSIWFPRPALFKALDLPFWLQGIL